MTFDVVIRGGTVVDGTGSQGRTADVGIADGRIAEIGRLDGRVTRVVDASGAVVCPGFIDLHSHADYTVLGSPEAVTQVTQGVTTLVTGNCGLSPFPTTPAHEDELLTHGSSMADQSTGVWHTAGEFADAIDSRQLGVNIALQVGHGAIRIAAMGLDDRAPTDAELETMRALVRQAAVDGVVGLSSGLIYTPGIFSETDELVALANEAVVHGLIYSTHMRDEGEKLLDAVEEALTVSRRTGIRLEISHLKSSGVQNWGKVGEALQRIKQARSEGIDVSTDQYPYTASSTTLTSYLPEWAMDGGLPALRQRLESSTQVDRLAADINERTGRTFWPERLVVARTPEGPYAAAIGSSITAFATAQQLDVGHALAELLRGQAGRVNVIHHGMSDDDVRLVMSDPDVAVASDGGILECPGAGVPHPRSFGTFVRVLGRYVRDEPLLELPVAIRKMTSLPASRLGWTDRGVLAPGTIADLAVFDPATVIDNSTYDDPWRLATGVRYTMLGGTFVLDDGDPTGADAGKVIRASLR